MNTVSKIFFILAALTAIAGCAHQSGVPEHATAALSVELDSDCQSAAVSDRPVRNHFKRARRIGRSSCNGGQ